MEGAEGLVAEAYGEKGVRKHMEDEHLICLDGIRAINQNVPAHLNFRIFGVFDGHGGRQTASFIKDNLASEVAAQIVALPSEEVPPESAPVPDGFIRKIVNAAFTKLDARLASEIAGCKDGCTAVVLLVLNNKAYIANLGDSSAYLCYRKDGIINAVPLTEPHKPWVIMEKERVIASGGTIENGRVNGSLEVTRSFGDISLKRYGVLCDPTFRKFTIDDRTEFVVIGCDGFWNCWSGHEVMTKATDLMHKARRRQQALGTGAPFAAEIKAVCKSLVEYVLIDKKSQDNVSVLLLKLK